jgi:glycerophosphoryl diester phosphodiesterase
MRCLLSCNGVQRPTTVRQLALGVGYAGADGKGAVCLSKLLPMLGPAPRPFYVVGHNPNTIEEVNAALDAGANAIEPDVNLDLAGNLRISEVTVAGTKFRGHSDAPSLTDFLDSLSIVAQRRPQLALVVFDVKPQAARSSYVATLLAETRRRLTTVPNPVNVIISTADRDHAGAFNSIKPYLGAREGLMIDSDNSPDFVSGSVFSDVENQCYGNGVADVFRDSVLAPHIRPSIERACQLRAELGRLKFIYTWSVGFEAPSDMREYIRIGVDGIIAGWRPAAFDSISVSKLRGVIDEPEFRSMVRLATREDNPFVPANAAYALTVLTDSRHNAGTDANITFTLTGTFGSSSKTVDASLKGSTTGATPGRMENGLDYVTLPSADLGDLISITVRRDNQGNAPGWYLNWIRVQSARYGGVSKQAIFNRWIDTSPFMQPLV